MLEIERRNRGGIFDGDVRTASEYMSLRGERVGSTAGESRQERGVSTTIGVVLVLAITVALAASVAGLVFGLSRLVTAST